MANKVDRPFLGWLSESLDKTAEFIAEFEGCKLTAYRCVAGVLTIGYGHTEGVREGDVITEEEAKNLLKNDIEVIAKKVARYVNIEVSEGQFVALTSLAFNIGVFGLVHDCPRLMRSLNSGDVNAAGLEFLDVNKANGQRVAGLTRRREAESRLFLEDFS